MRLIGDDASKRAQLLATMLIVLIGVLAWERSDDGKLPVVGVAPEEVADNYTTDLTAVQMNADGALQYHLHTDEAAHYLHTDETLLKFPILLNYADDGSIWRSVADHGRVRAGGDVIDLWDNVSLRRADDGLQIVSPNISVNTARGEAETDAVVSLKRPGSELHGKGMHVDINNEIVSLLEDVRGSYATATSE